ncbi:MAG: hypothetical protein LUD84_05520 [Clostridiales bacterium]|nr:hypothetical protein [Clostridiales bacterium]
MTRPLEIHLTTRAAAEYDYLSSGAMTPEMAANYLQGGCIELRTFSEILRDQYPYPDIRARLTAFFQACETNTATASVARKVQNWLNGRNQPTSREDVFRIAFALDLSEGQASLLLGQCTEYGIHYRDPKDVIYAWFLRNDGSYEEAHTFYQSLPPVPRLKDYPQADGVRITRELQSVFFTIHTQENLRRAYLDNIDKFGQLHVRAYHYFEKYMKQLTHPDNGWGGADEQDYSIEKVMEQYLSLHMPSGRNRTRYSVTQKLLKRNWPNATSLKNILAHREDVPRKLLLILYIVTENAVDGEYCELDEDYLSLQDRLEDHWWVLNAILTDCGMPTLDPRNATDWLVLYALTAREDESMSERMTQVIDHLFADIQE